MCTWCQSVADCIVRSPYARRRSATVAVQSAPRTRFYSVVGNVVAVVAFHSFAPILSTAGVRKGPPTLPRLSLPLFFSWNFLGKKREQGEGDAARPLDFFVGAYLAELVQTKERGASLPPNGLQG